MIKMVEYKIEISPEFKEKFSNLDKGVQDRARKELEKLPTRNHKNNVLKWDLTGFYAQHFWKNKYRIIYIIEDHILKILAIWIGKRNDNFYNDLKKYLKRTGKL
jgi:mRNA-degrading endonuclease RelE of RelBE toxin-antitoxin system